MRSAATAAGAFLSIGLPPAGQRYRRGRRPWRASRLRSGSRSRPTARSRCISSRPRWASTSAPALAQIIAEELEVKWDDVRLDSPLESVENFAIYGLAYTVNSGSITTEFDRLSRAGAAGRMALIEAGAKVLGAKRPTATAENRRVIDSVSGRSVGYGEIIQKVKIDRKFAYPDDFKAIKLKAPGSLQASSASRSRRIDIPAKTNGQAKYGIDVFLPNMVYGALVIPRTRYGSKVQSIDDSEAQEDPGIHQGGEGRRQHGQVHRLGRRAGREVPGCR